MKILRYTVLSALVATLFLACGTVPRATPTIYLIGDSTAANKQEDKRPETGWGEALAGYFQPGIVVDNHARNGRSTRSFRNEGLWDAVQAKLQPGDYVFMQFGHNDPKEGETRFSSPAQYKDNLEAFAREARAKGANPVILTPVVRRHFENGQLVATHGDYPEMAREAAHELGIPLIDMTVKSKEVVQRYGDPASTELYLWVEEGANENYPDGVEDNTHFSPLGAQLMAGLVADGIREQKLPLRRYLARRPK